MRFSLKLLETDSQFRKLALEQLSKEVKKVLDSAIPQIKNSVQNLIKQNIMSEPEYSSLTSSQGKLRLEFGIDNTMMVDMAIDNIVNTVNITLKPVKIANVGLTGGFLLTAIESDELQMISKSFAQMTEKGVSLEWLRWLLFEGASPIVKGYDVSFSNNNPYSRTGGAVMVKVGRKSWRVPPEYIGTVKNNWITRAIDKTDEAITKIIQAEIENKI